MADLSSLTDVKRILRLTDDDTDRDAQLRASLEAVEDWAKQQLPKIPDRGNQVEVYFDINEDATLNLPASDVTVVKVNVFEYPVSSGIELAPFQLGLGMGYEQTDNGRLILRPILFVSPFEGALSERRLRRYSRVEVHYIATGEVPRGITEGIAYLAAGYWTEGPRILSGLSSEKIGDYSYTQEQPDSSGQVAYVKRAMWFLKPYMRRSRVAVI